MKIINVLTVAALSILISACGGHGYEGKYRSAAESKNEGVNLALSSIELKDLVIGENYFEGQGNREIFDEINVQTRGEKEYLVFTQGDSELTMEIVDDNTLILEAGAIDVTLVRVD